MINFSTCARTAAVFLFFAMEGIVSAQPSSRGEQETTGILKGELPLPRGLAGPQPFILAYSADYGERKIPVEVELSIARFEVKLRPGAYYLFVALDGYLPTCHVAEIGAGEVVLYNPKLGAPFMTNVIKEYSLPPRKIDLQIPLRQSQMPPVFPLPPR